MAESKTLRTTTKPLLFWHFSSRLLFGLLALLPGGWRSHRGSIQWAHLDGWRSHVVQTVLVSWLVSEVTPCAYDSASRQQIFWRVWWVDVFLVKEESLFRCWI